MAPRRRSRALFVFIGAEPRTAWLGGQLTLDDHGFVLCGQELQLTHLEPAGDRRQPLPLETSRAGVFVAGDLRAGSINGSSTSTWRCWHDDHRGPGSGRRRRTGSAHQLRSGAGQLGFGARQRAG